MKNLILFLLGSFLLLTTQTVFADDVPPPNTVPMSTIIKKLKKEGYKIIEKIKYEDSVYEAEVFDDHGVKEKININPQTGQFPTSKKVKRISILQATEKVEAAGYHGIYKVEYEDGVYEMKAFDKSNKKVKLKIDAESGKISEELF